MAKSSDHAQIYLVQYIVKIDRKFQLYICCTCKLKILAQEHRCSCYFAKITRQSEQTHIFRELHAPDLKMFQYPGVDHLPFLQTIFAYSLTWQLVCEQIGLSFFYFACSFLAVRLESRSAYILGEQNMFYEKVARALMLCLFTYFSIVS